MTKDDLLFDFKVDCGSVSIVLPVPVNISGYPPVEAFAYYVTNNKKTEGNIRYCAENTVK